MRIASFPPLAQACVFVALALLACGSRTELAGSHATVSQSDSGAGFPVGTYTSCAMGTVSSGGPFLLPSGFEQGATLTVTQSGATRTATYVGGGAQDHVWSFATTSDTSATLASSPQTTAGFGSGICVYGIGVSNEKFFPTELSAESGAMTYESGTVFVSLQGALTSKMECGDVSSPASAWIVCAGGPAPASAPAASLAALPTGAYACTSQVATHATVDGMNEYITSGGDGALLLSQTGAQITAQYAGDGEAAGTIQLAATTASTANGDAGQSLSASCGLDPTKGELAIGAASLMLDGATVFLSIAGTMGPSSPCPGAQKVVTLVCVKS